MHGFNRLGGNSVAETIVAGMIVGEYIADYCDAAQNEVTLPTALVRDAMRREQRHLEALASGENGKEDATALRTRMQQIMTDKVGVFRTGEALKEAVDELTQLLARSRHIGLRYSAMGANPELVTAYRVQKMLKVALCVAQGALSRTESRGAHFREDYPRRDDVAWLSRTLASWPDADSLKPKLAWESIDIDAMELPPGWRGYGLRDHIEHPQTAQRAARVEDIRKTMTHASRIEIQSALMPYESLLPERYRGTNERIDDHVQTQKVAT
jgi:fumarate reductase flavoprotein subunit